MLTRSLAIAATFAASLSAQTLVAPAAALTGDLNSSTGYPFDYASAIRVIYTMDSSHFTAQSVNSPILISQMRLRANGATLTWTGSSVNSLTVDLSTSPVDWSAMSATFDNNHGANRAQVFSGPLSWGAGSSTTGQAGPYVWDIVFATPFLYDPTAGDLTIDFLSSGTLSTAQTPSHDCSTTAGVANGSRVYGLSYAGAPTGTLQGGPIALPIEFTYTPAVGYASATSYGSGCYDTASTVYESFTGANFDLAGAPTNSLQFLQNAAGGFSVVPGSNSFFTPTSADLLLGDDTVSAALALPYAFQFGTLSTTSVKMASNGYLWLRDTETSSDLSPSTAELLTLGPRIAPFWTDLNPASLDPTTQARIGSCHFDVDPATNNPVFTWLSVPEYGAANTANVNTFQIELYPTGAFEIRWQGMAVTAARAVMTAVSYGLGVRDGGATDLSAAVPFSTNGDASALRFAASARPTLGTSITLDTTSIPASAQLGAVLFGLTKIDPGLDLGGLGAPGCRQYLSLDGSAIFLTSGGSHSLPQSFPNDPAFVGVQIKAQAAVIAPGVNALNLLTSNGVELTFDVN